MSKIICEICGTTYPETAECCPICGCAKDAVKDLLNEEIPLEEVEAENQGKTGLFTSKKKEIFDFDEANEDPEDEEDDEEDSDDEEDEEDDEPRHNTFVVILLTILIAGLLIAVGFIFVRYFLPNMNKDNTPSTTAPIQVLETESTEATEMVIPCEYITMNNDSIAELVEEGQQFLLNVIAKPENTTDKIIYVSEDESIATVSEDGKVTAVSEGETNIYISCGKYDMKCPVIVKYSEETVPPTTEDFYSEETVTNATEPEETEETVPADPSIDPNVVLKLKKEDIRLGVYYQFTLELDCALKPDQVQWSSEHPHIATVDENGVVTAIKEGTTAIIAKYGDQQVQCIIRAFNP